jgi:hypothetical protein
MTRRRSTSGRLLPTGRKNGDAPICLSNALEKLSNAFENSSDAFEASSNALDAQTMIG